MKEKELSSLLGRVDDILGELEVVLGVAERNPQLREVAERIDFTAVLSLKNKLEELLGRA